MNKQTILLADNDKDFLATCGEFLETAGYHILTADSPDEAKKLLETSRIHLAILDLRMENDHDEKDRSGLLLAKNAARSIPKLILTRFPTYQDVVEALRLDIHELPPAVDFLDKREDLSQLLATIQRVLDEHLAINWNLLIQWTPILSSAQLVTWIEPKLDSAYLGERTAELEDVFRQLFRQHGQITVSRLLTYGQGYVLLSLYAYDIEGLETLYIVTCGQNEIITEEARRYQTAVSPHLSQPHLNYEVSANTLHFAANAYRLVGSRSEEPLDLQDFYLRHPASQTGDVIEHLFRTGVGAWYKKGQTFLNQEESVHNFYQDWLKVSDPAVSERQWQQKVEAICKKNARAGGGELEYSTQTLTFHPAPEEPAARFPNPIAGLHDKRFGGHAFVQWGLTHGRVNLETVLVDQNGRSWLIDFTQAARGPLMHDFVSLETAVKLHLATSDLYGRYLLEQKLAEATALNDKPDPSSLPETIQQTMALVLRIRQLAAELTGCSLDAYLTGLYFHAANHLATYQSDIHYPRQSFTTYAHALLAAAIQCQKLSDPPRQQADLPDYATQTLWIDKDNKAVWVEGMPIDLTIQDYQILTYLYDHANQLCERQAIITQGLGEEYDAYYPEESRLNSAMSRLRQKIEPNPQNPKYLVTVRGRGYKLVL
jgi:DNA-binding response OmpR family regulator